MRVAKSLAIFSVLYFMVSFACCATVGEDRAEGDEPSVAVVDVDVVTADQRRAMCDHLKTSGRAPADYIVSRFVGHDLVIVGETHQVRENCRVLSDVIEPLYERAGVRLLLSEFVRDSNTDRLNELLTAKEWNAEGVHGIMRDWAWPTWGFVEYRDIYHAVWKVNRDREETDPPFRVAGLDSDWDQYEYAWSGMSRKEKFEDRLAREEHLVAVAEREAFAAGRKALVHIGYSHSLTGHGIKFGTVLTKNHGARVFQIVLHPKLPARRGAAPLTLFLESLWKDAGSRPVGFDVLGSPLGRLRDEKCVFWSYLENGAFEEFAQGYIIIAPIDKLHKATWIPGFVDEALFERARSVAIAARMVKAGECETAEALDGCLQRLFPAPADGSRSKD